MSEVYTGSRGTGREGKPTVTSVQVDSFSTPNLSYEVKLYHRADGIYLGASCTCGAEVYGSGCSKHKALAPALQKIRALDFGAERHEQRLLSLAKRLYSKPGKGETAAQSMDLVYEVDAERFSTPALRRQSWLRHGIIVERCFGPEEAA